MRQPELSLGRRGLPLRLVYQSLIVYGTLFAVSACNAVTGVDELSFHGSDVDTDTDADGDSDTDTDTDADADSDTDSDADTDADGGEDTETETCVDAWNDEDTNLMWENPPTLLGSVNWNDAVIYCDNLERCGLTDWRLPKIQELISLERGCVGTVETGDLSPSECGISDPACLDSSCLDTSCGACDIGGGPDDSPSGCYWIPELAGDCKWFWSSSTQSDNSTIAWNTNFNAGNITGFDKNTVYDYVGVRCVRDL